MYLGFVIDENCIRADQKKVEAIRALAVPNCVKEIRFFCEHVSLLSYVHSIFHKLQSL